MQLKNSQETYGLIAVLLHWAVALGMIGGYMAVYYRHWFTDAKTAENWTALQLHLSFGVTVGAIVLLRIVWKVLNITPVDAPGTRLEHFASHMMHRVLYAVMVIMPVTGYLGTGAATEYFFLFDIPKFADTALFRTVVENGLGMTFKEFEAPLDFVHKNAGAYVVWVLVALHAGAALYHHFVRKDFILKRMLFAD